MSREDRIMNLAATLKASGLAKSEVQAKMMAEEMIGVEENVQKSYEEEHTKAHEYLKTAKNLGIPRSREQPKQEQQEQRPKIEPIGTRVQPVQSSPPQSMAEEKKPAPEISSTQNTLLKSVDESAHDKKVELESVHTDVDFGKGSLKDMMLNQIKAEHHEIKTIEQLEEEAEEKAEATVEEKKEQETHETPVKDVAEPAEKKAVEEVTRAQEVNEQPKEDVKEETHSDEEKSPKDSPDDSKEAPKLDGDKLREMMEEDGPLEEHTREIKEKPKDVKPKEEYAENNIDLGDVFNFNKK